MLKLGTELIALIKESLSINIITDDEPQYCGYKINDKDVYVKRINLGNLPNASTKDVDIGIPSNQIGSIIEIKGMAYSSAVGYLPLPYPYGTTTGGIGVYINISSTNSFIRIGTGADRSAFTAYVDLYFTYQTWFKK